MDVYQAWLEFKRRRQGGRERATLPNIMPSHYKNILQTGISQDESTKPRRGSARLLLQLVSDISLRRASGSHLQHRRASSSRSGGSDEDLNIVSPLDRRGSLADRRGSGTVRRGSRGSLKRNSLSIPSTMPCAGRWANRDTLTEEEEAQRSKKLHAKFRSWTQVVRALIAIYRKYSKLDKDDASNPFYGQLEAIEKTNLGIDKTHYIFFDPADYKANKQMRMSSDGQRILSKVPELRTNEELHHVMIALRGIKEIEDLPLRMQLQLAKYGTFETFEPKRVIVKQHHKPENFYFILFGTVLVAVLQESGYAKTEVELSRGHSFGELAIMNRSSRQSSVITKTDVELLSISEENYRRIFMVGGAKTLHDPDQRQFLGNIGCLKGWPINILTEQEPKHVTFAYFRCKTVIIKDSNASDWIIIVKSGSVTVLKKLVKVESSLNKRTGRHYHIANNDGFIAFKNNAIAYRRYLKYNNKILPEPLSISLNNGFLSGTDDTSTGSDVTSDVRISSKTSDDVDRFYNHVNRRYRPMTCAPRIAMGLKRTRVSSSAVYSGTTTCNNKSPLLKTPSETSSTISGRESKQVTNRHQGRIRTFLDDLDTGCRSQTQPLTEADLKPQFVLVQTLTRGQVFGLAQVVLGRQPSMCVVSNGAECLMINRKFYLDNCTPHMIRRLKTELSPYPSDAKLQEDLCVRVDWDMYKQCVTQQLSPYPSDAKLQEDLCVRVDWDMYKQCVTQQVLTHKPRIGLEHTLPSCPSSSVCS